MGDIDKNTTCNTTQLSLLLGISVRQVQYHIQNGMFAPVDGKKGVFNLADSVKSYVSFLKKGDEEDKNLDTRKIKADIGIKEARAKRENLFVKELEGQMHRSEDVQAMTEDLIYNIRSALLTLPGRLSVDVAALSNPMECSEVIKAEVYSIMKDLTDYEYDPKKYEERVRERLNWAEKEAVADAED